MIDDTQVQESEVQEQAVAEEPQQETQKQEITPQQTYQQQQETESQRNFASLRSDKARVERELEETRRRMKELEERQSDTEIAVGDEDIVEGKHLKVLRNEQKRLRDEIRASREELMNMTLESRIKSQFPDFEQVFTKENIDKLNRDLPELASSVAADPDNYRKAVNAYTLIKKFGIGEGDPYMADKQKIQANAMKPRPLATVSPQEGGSPLEKANMFANGLTPELKKQLYKEMVQAAKNKQY